MEELSIKSCFLKFKVTSVKCIGDFIYAGIGGNLLIFRSSKRNLREEIKNVLPNNIYGILPDDESKNIAIYGNKKLTVIPAYKKGYEWEKTHIWEATQWIQCVQWLNSESLAVTTGLNEVDLLNWTTKQVEKTAVCEEKCIIYSAHLIGSDWKNLIVLAGTVYREILVWSPYKAEQSSTSVIHRLKGHNGVIFSVTYHHATRRICSTSDDRTVRIWKVVNAEQCDQLSLDQWINSKIEATITIFGHTARVWKSALLDDGRIVSIGEDSLLCIWDETGKNELRQETHQGGRICCLDIDKQRGLAITGGADGGINLWSLDSGPNEIIRTVLPDDEPVRLLVLKSGATVVVFRSGCLMECQSSRIVFQDARFVNYCLADVAGNGKYVALGSIHGDLLILNDEIKRTGTLSLLTEKKIFDGKIFSLQWVHLESDYVLCCGSEGRMLLYKLEKNNEGFHLKLLNRFNLPASKERWVTCAIFALPFLLCGTRNGSIHVYKWIMDNGCLMNGIEDPVQSLHKIHGTSGVTSFFFEVGSYYRCSTGRDGTIKKYSWNFSTGIRPVLVGRLPFSWVAKIIDPEMKEDIGNLVIGFHEKDVVIWSERLRVIIWRMDCCGGHREWKCFVKSKVLHFYFIKDKTVHLIKKPLGRISYTPLLDGFHTREVNTLVISMAMSNSYIKEFSPSPKSGFHSYNASLLVSSGEDNTLRISFMKLQNSQTLVTDVVLTGHLSSVRTLAVVSLENEPGGINRCLIFSAGGRAQMKVWSLEIIDGSLFYNAESATVSESVELSSHMINGEEEMRKNSKSLVPRLDPETRYMDISVYKHINNDQRFTVFLACSDGYLRVFDFSRQDKVLTLITELSHQCCLLKTALITVDNWKNLVHPVLVLTTTTDGRVCVWDTENKKQIFNHQVFDSGINSCDVFEMIGGKCLVALGGDNCKVAIELIDLNKVSIVGLWASSELHFSQVSGVKLLEENLLFTVGVDQRFNVLKWSLSENDELEVVHLRQYCTYVPDVHGFSVFRREVSYDVCIFGVGFEVLEVRGSSIQRAPASSEDMLCGSSEESDSPYVSDELMSEESKDSSEESDTSDCSDELMS